MVPAPRRPLAGTVQHPQQPLAGTAQDLPQADTALLPHPQLVDTVNSCLINAL